MRVVVADDTLLVREGVVRLLAAAGFDVVGESATAEDLLLQVDATAPDVAIVDIRMPPSHTDEGMRAAVRIRASHPGTGIVVLSQHADPGIAMTLLSGGAVGIGYLLKESVADAADLADAVRRVAAGGLVLDPVVASGLLGRKRRGDRVAGMSDREREVLQLMAEGRSNQGIADRMEISARAVQKHAASIFEQLDLPAGGDDHRRVLAVLAYLRS